MRLSATDKAIGELNMRRADIDRARDYIEEHTAENAVNAIKGDIADIDRCITLLKSVGSAQAAPVVKKPRAARKAKKSETDA